MPALPPCLSALLKQLCQRWRRCPHRMCHKQHLQTCSCRVRCVEESLKCTQGSMLEQLGQAHCLYQNSTCKQDMLYQTKRSMLEQPGQHWRRHAHCMRKDTIQQAHAMSQHAACLQDLAANHFQALSKGKTSMLRQPCQLWLKACATDSKTLNTKVQRKCMYARFPRLTPSYSSIIDIQSRPC